MAENTGSGAGVGAVIRRAVSHLADGRPGEAEAELHSVLETEPDQPDALHFLGLVCAETGRHDEAVDWISKAIESGRPNPAHYFNLGLVLADLGRLEEAETAHRKAVELAPDNAEFLTSLGGILHKRDKADEAAEAFEAAIDRDPQSFNAVNGLAMAKEAQGLTVEAEVGYRRALELGEAPSLYFNLGNVLKDQHRADEAVDAFNRAIDMRSDFAEAHVHLAFALLLRGDFEQAWREYEWRWAVPVFGTPVRKLPQPMWDGKGLDGQCILLHAEQGFGDTLQFARYAAVANRMGGRVVLECEPQLTRLMETAAGVERAVPRGDTVTGFDCHAPLLSVPRLLGTTIDTIPGDSPYLFAPAAAATKWKERLAGEAGLKVGIAWQGSMEKRGNPTRACPLAALRPLLEEPGVRLFSLQKDPPESDLPLPEAIVDLSGELVDFAETAAVMEALDLVVTIDTAVSHLAGGLGRPTWVLLSTASDWRWLMEREDSPWYPSARLFRQTGPRRWEDVVARVQAALRDEFQVHG